MAETQKKLVIRVSAEDAGVARVMRDIQKQTRDTMKSVRAESVKPIMGPAIRPRFDFNEQLVRKEAARILQKVREDTQRQTIRVHAEVVARTSRGRVFGPDPVVRGPLGDVSGRHADEQLIRDRRARLLRAQRDDARALSQNAAKTGFGGFKLNKTAELLRGGGAAIGIHVVAQTLKNAAEEAVKLRNEMATGAITAGDIPDRLLPTIPILGNIWDAGRAIRELFTQEAAEAAKITAEAERTNQFIAARTALIKANADAERESRERVREDQNRAADAGLSPRDRAEAQARRDRDAGLKEIRDRAAAQQAALDSTKAEEAGLEPSAAAAEMKRLKEEVKNFVAPPEAETRVFVDASGGSSTSFDADADARRKDALKEQKSRNARIVTLEDEIAAELVAINNRRIAEERAANNAFDAERRAADDQALRDRTQKNRDGVRKKMDEAARMEREAQQKAEEETRKRESADRGREQLVRSLADARIEGLKTEAELGDRNAAVEAKRLQIAEDYRRKRQEILDTIKDELATPQQRDAARAMLRALPDQQRRESERLGAASNPLPQTANFQAGNAFTLGQISPDGEAAAQQQIAKNTRDQVDRANKQLTQTEKLIRIANEQLRVALSMSYGSRGIVSLQ